MNKILLFLSLFLTNYCFSQSVNDYKAIIIPLKYDFQKEENQYRLQTLTKFNLTKAGFQAFYSNESITLELNDRCKLLTVDLKKESGFLVTKLIVVFKDCYGVEIFKSEVGKSREKQFEEAYKEALNNAFVSIYALEYKDNPNLEEKLAIIPEITTQVVNSIIPIKTTKSDPNKVLENSDATLLYAQPTSYGYQLIDIEPKVVMKVFKTSNPVSFMATKGSVQGILVAKDNQWFFEYYQNDLLISEMINVKF
jgi:hypothetical protein